jgi:N4-gp56 family major capsid protein
MAKGNTVSIAGLRSEMWRKTLFADVEKDSYIQSRFVSTSDSAVIQKVEDFEADPRGGRGAKVNFGISIKLSGDGVSGDDELEGQEEAITTYEEELEVNQLRHAVRLTGQMDELKSAYDMRADAKEKLKIWWIEKIDYEILAKLCGYSSATFANTPAEPSASRAVFAGGQSAESSLTSTMVFDTKVIEKAKQTAKLASPKVRPIMIGGKATYVMFIHPYQRTDLRRDPVWNQAQRDANVRGADNPIFSGAEGVYDGVVIHEHEQVHTNTGGSGSAACARAILCGAQAAVLGIGAPKKWVEKKFDYENQWGVACGLVFGVQKVQFNSVDYGVVTVHTAATAASTS